MPRRRRYPDTIEGLRENYQDQVALLRSMMSRGVPSEYDRAHNCKLWVSTLTSAAYLRGRYAQAVKDETGALPKPPIGADLPELRGEVGRLCGHGEW